METEPTENYIQIVGYRDAREPQLFCNAIRCIDDSDFLASSPLFNRFV